MADAWLIPGLAHDAGIHVSVHVVLFSDRIFSLVINILCVGRT